MDKDASYKVVSNAPLVMRFKYEFNVLWQYVTIDNEIREASKHLEEIKKRKENRYNIGLYSIISIIIIVIIVSIIVVTVIIIIFRFEVVFFLKDTILCHLHAFDPRILRKR